MLTQSRCQLVYVAFDDVDQFSVDCVEKYETALVEAQEAGIKIRALLICNPHNPLGICYPKETLEALYRFCEKYNLHLVSDEIYALSVFEVEGLKRTPFTSVLALDSRDLVRTDQIHVLYGMSKVDY
jgi:xeroderma pigmentosum group C-complementing protein